MQMSRYYEALNSLPDNNVPPDILSVEADDSVISDSLNSSKDLGPIEERDDIVYDDNTETSSFTLIKRKKKTRSMRNSYQAQLIGHLEAVSP